MAKFKVGDKVISIKPVCEKKVTGAIGTIVDIDIWGDHMPYLVKFDEDIDGPNSVHARQGGWWCHEDDIELVKENNMFTKKDLKEFDVVKLRNGEILIVMKNGLSKEGYGIFSPAHFGCYQYFEDYNDDLTRIEGKNQDDIVAIKRYDSNHSYSHISDFFDNSSAKFTYPDYDWDWERKEVEEMTLEEVCKALGKEIKIVKK